MSSFSRRDKLSWEMCRKDTNTCSIYTSVIYKYIYIYILIKSTVKWILRADYLESRLIHTYDPCDCEQLPFLPCVMVMKVKFPSLGFVRIQWARLGEATDGSCFRYLERNKKPLGAKGSILMPCPLLEPPTSSSSGHTNSLLPGGR